MRATSQDLLRQLHHHGYQVSTFSLSTVGDYSVEDADWNYKDVPHLNVVHSQVEAIGCTMDDDVGSSIALQKILGIPVPISLVNWVTKGGAHTYYTSLGPYVLVVSVQIESLGTNRTKVTTTYNLATSGLWRLGFPILKRILTRNFRTLTSEDTPMRDRRGELRRRGFRFHSDGRARTFPESLDLLVDNVVVPLRSAQRTESIDLATVAVEGATVLVGPDDDRGVRVVRSGAELIFVPRLCAHEGASLDCARLMNGRVSCPWHAKRIAPLGRIAAIDGATGTFGRLSAVVRRGILELSLPDDSG